MSDDTITITLEMDRDTLRMLVDAVEFAIERNASMDDETQEELQDVVDALELYNE